MEQTVRGAHPNVPELSEAEGWWARQGGRLPRVIYWGIHAACLLALWVGVSSGDLLLCATTLFVRMFGITGVYHRYFAHRTYKLNRFMQFEWLNGVPQAVVKQGLRRRPEPRRSGRGGLRTE